MIRSGTVDGSKSRSQWTSNNANIALAPFIDTHRSPDKLTGNEQDRTQDNSPDPKRTPSRGRALGAVWADLVHTALPDLRSKITFKSKLRTTPASTCNSCYTYRPSHLPGHLQILLPPLEATVLDELSSALS
ncbi:hypothetical protein ABKN59_003842 [Abortiporus biennis]